MLPCIQIQFLEEGGYHARVRALHGVRGQEVELRADGSGSSYPAAGHRPQHGGWHKNSAEIQLKVQ